MRIHVEQDSFIGGGITWLDVASLTDFLGWLLHLIAEIGAGCTFFNSGVSWVASHEHFSNLASKESSIPVRALVILKMCMNLE